MKSGRAEPAARRWIAGLTMLCGLTALLAVHSTPATAQVGPDYSLRFYGAGADDVDRVKIQIDDPANALPGPPADVGAADFTLEFWMKARADENPAGGVECGANTNWILGHIVFDRDRFDQSRKFGLSLAGGVMVFGVSGAGDQTICGTAEVLDDRWHHIAVQRRRSDGWMWLFVDGGLDAQAEGPGGDISYPDSGAPVVRADGYCLGPEGAWGGVCRNDSFLVIGAEKHDAGPEYPSYGGWIDEVRLSNGLRYLSDFAQPTQPFTRDAITAALYHFDEGPEGPCAGPVLDSSGASGGPSHGMCSFGGSNRAGPVYTTDTPFIARAATAAPTGTSAPTDTRAPTETPTATAAASLTHTAQPAVTLKVTPEAQVEPDRPASAARLVVIGVAGVALIVIAAVMAARRRAATTVDRTDE